MFLGLEHLNEAMREFESVSCIRFVEKEKQHDMFLNISTQQG